VAGAMESPTLDSETRPIQKNPCGAAGSHGTAVGDEGVRVLFVVPGSPDGFSMIFARRQIEALEAAGIQGSSFFLSSRTSPLALLDEWKRLRKAIRDFSPLIVHAHYGTITAFLCATATGLPLVITYRGSDLNPCSQISPIQSMVGRFLSQLAALRASRIICVSRQLRERLWWRKSRAQIIPTGLNLQLFFPMDRDSARAKLAWSLEERIVLFNASRNPMGKRLELATQAVDLVRQRMGDVRFVVMKGDVDPDLVPYYMNAADCLLVTSEQEGSPNVVKEALACRLPIVSVDVGDVSERLQGADQCSIVAPNPGSLAAAVSSILNENRRSNGDELVAALDNATIVQELITIYRSVSRERVAPKGKD
jgi:teichuronic acid biosynthesis glycosyltransferase TuaC